VAQMSVEIASRTLFRRLAWPLLSDYAEIAGTQTTSLELALSHSLGGRLGNAALQSEGQSAEFGAATRSDAPNRYPPAFNSSPATVRLLHELIVRSKPAIVVETGVANGISTRGILGALALNDHGVLISFDTDPGVSECIPEDLSSRWRLVALDRTRRRSAFQREISGLGPIDIFFHDSDHSYMWQMFEYREAWTRLRPGGFLISDDVDASFAFLDFSVEKRSKPTVLVTERKVTGLIRKGSESPYPDLPVRSAR
jgi:predicted O-methyltransferase YrrM